MKLKKFLFLTVSIVCVCAFLSSCGGIKEKLRGSDRSSGKAVLENISHSDAGSDDSSERVSGDGTTPGKAIVLVPTGKMKTAAGVSVTRKDNLRWFYIKLQGGKTYYFETFGKGDPDAYVYKKEKVRDDGTISGEAEKRNSDDGRDGNNFLINFTPSASGEYYLKIILFSGQGWSGKMNYRIK